MSEWKVPVADILEWYSPDYYCSVGEAVAGGLPDLDGEYYRKLYRKMRGDGINKVPVLREDYLGEDYPEVREDYPARLGNGHHRVRIGWLLGWDEMAVTDDRWESGFSGELKDERARGVVRLCRCASAAGMRPA